MTYKRLSTKGKIKFWTARLKLRKRRLDRSRRRREYYRGVIKKANERIAKIKSELSLISDEGVEFVAFWEGFFSKPYNDPVGHCTVGYGHLLHRGNCVAEDMDDVWIIGQKKPGQLSKAEGRELLKKDLTNFAKGVRDLTDTWNKLPQNKRDALISFAYNCGLGAYQDSTLRKYVNQGDIPRAAKEFGRWVYADGQKLPGLVNRREAERKMFLGI